MKTRVRIAETSQDVVRCQELIALVYRDYGVTFSSDTYDLERKVERWPHQFIMATIDDQVVAAVGLYTRDTYVEHFRAGLEGFRLALRPGGK